MTRGFRAPRWFVEQEATEERQRQDQKRLEDDQAEHVKYIQGIENEQRRVPPSLRIKPLDFETWRGYAPQDQHDPAVRAAMATNRELAGRVRENEKAAVLAGRPDPEFTIPDDAKGLSMSVEKAKDFARKQGELFTSQRPDYFPTRKNFEAVVNYLTSNRVTIPTVGCFEIAVNRLRALGLIEERPAPAPAPEPVPQPEPQLEAVSEPQDELVDGFDPETGEARNFSQREISRMSADEYRRAFRVVPRFSRSYFGGAK